MLNRIEGGLASSGGGHPYIYGAISGTGTGLREKHSRGYHSLTKDVLISTVLGAKRAKT
jgi:hypothetical protein